MGAPPRGLISSATGSVRGRGFGLPPRVCVAYVNVLVGFMSEKVTDTAFDSTSCVGSVGTGAASTGSSAGEEAPDAPGITSVRTASQRLAVTASIISRSHPPG